MTRPASRLGDSCAAARAEEAAAIPLDPDVAGAASGDAAAFDRLVRRYQDDVVHAAYYFLGHYDDAVDVAQEAFLKAYRGIGRFRGGASFRTWILTITVNSARSLRSRQRAKKRSANVISIDTGRHASRDGSDGPSLDVADAETSSAPDTLLERKELKEAIEAALVELEEPARQLVVLRDVAGESYEAIAGALGLPVGTVKSRVHRARLLLQARLAAMVG